MLGLNKLIYQKTAAYGHFGRNPGSDGAFLEKTDKTSILKSNSWKIHNINYK